MTDDKEQQADNKIQDLTVSETETTNIKGGAAVDYFLELDGIKGETNERNSR